MSDPQAGMVRILQATLDAESEGPGDLTPRVRTALVDTPDDEYAETVMLLKSSRCLDVIAERAEDGSPVITKIKGITTRGLRELQKAAQEPTAQHSCPTDGDDGRMGFS